MKIGLGGENESEEVMKLTYFFACLFVSLAGSTAGFPGNACWKWGLGLLNELAGRLENVS